MKTRSLIALVSSFAITILVGTVFIGANAVFGVVAPTENPDNARGITPTFSGVNVTGDLNLGRDVSITHGSDLTGFFMSIGNKSLYTGSTFSNAMMMIGTIAGRNIIMVPDSFKPNGSFKLEVPAASSLTLGAGMGDNTMVLRNDNVTVNGASTIARGLTIGTGTADVRLEDLTVNGGGTIVGALNVLMHSIVESLSVNRQLTAGSFEVRGLANFRGPTVMGDVEILNGSTLDVNGDIDLPFSFVSANINNNTAILKNTQAVCPPGKIVISCQQIFTGGYANVQAPGTMTFANICQGRYNQTAANAVTGLVMATCL